MNDIQLTKRQAFLAMHAFLEHAFQLSGSDDIGALLGSISLLQDGTTADPAAQEDWDRAVEAAISGNVDAQLRFTHR